MTMNLSAMYPQLHVAIDYPAARALRQMAAHHDEYQQYLLAPEVCTHLHYVPLSDPQYVAQLEMMVATLKIPL